MRYNKTFFDKNTEIPESQAVLALDTSFRVVFTRGRTKVNFAITAANDLEVIMTWHRTIHDFSMEVEKHRKDGPQFVTGKIAKNHTSKIFDAAKPEDIEKLILNRDHEVWYRGDRTHRSGGPAFSVYREGFRSQTWYHMGVVHRVDGPAAILEKAGEPTSYQWFFENQQIPLHGEKITIDQLIAILNKSNKQMVIDIGRATGVFDAQMANTLDLGLSF